MAGRKDKNTVDYFPHYCIGGKTLYIIENKYGNNGYAVMFKTFELLGSSENHFYDFREIENQEFVSARTRTEIPELIKIYDTLSNLGTIHKELWEYKIIFSVNFVKNICDAYERRKNQCITFSNLCDTLGIKCKHKYDLCGNLLYINTQSKVKESKLNKSKEKLLQFPPNLASDIFLSKFNEWKEYRAEIKKTLSITTQQKQIDYLAGFSQEVAIKMIDQSIRNSWQGLFELKENSHNGQHQSSKLSRRSQEFEQAKYDQLELAKELIAGRS